MAVIALALLWSSTVHADAQDLFEKGEQAFQDSDFRAAAEAFEAAHQQRPHVSVLFNAAVSWDHAGETARAATDYSSALAQGGLTPAQALQAESRLDALTAVLGLVQVSQPVGGAVTVDFVDAQAIPTRFYLPPGHYQVKLETERGTAMTPVEVRAGERLRLVLNEVERAVVSPAPPPERPSPVEPPAKTTPEGDSSLWKPTLGWIGLGVGVAASGAAIYLGLGALNARARFDSSGHTDAAARQSATTLRAATNVAWGAAALFGIGGGVLLLTTPTFEF